MFCLFASNIFSRVLRELFAALINIIIITISLPVSLFTVIFCVVHCQYNQRYACIVKRENFWMTRHELNYLNMYCVKKFDANFNCC